MLFKVVVKSTFESGKSLVNHSFVQNCDLHMNYRKAKQNSLFNLVGSIVHQHNICLIAPTLSDCPRCYRSDLSAVNPASILVVITRDIMWSTSRTGFFSQVLRFLQTVRPWNCYIVWEKDKIVARAIPECSADKFDTVCWDFLSTIAMK